jgi:hypothetical protein
MVAQVASMPPFQPPAPAAPGLSGGAVTASTTAAAETGAPVAAQPQAAGDSWFSGFDLLIAFLVLLIAVLICRRFVILEETQKLR